MIGRLRRTVPSGAVRVLALLLALQWGAAFGHCLQALAASGLTIEICAADGLRTLHLAPDAEKERAPVAAHAGCPLCPGGAAADPAPAQVAPQRIAFAAPPPPSPAGLPPAPPRAPPQQPRAPPFA